MASPAVYARRKADGRCTQCGGLKVKGGTKCARCTHLGKIHQRASRRRVGVPARNCPICLGAGHLRSHCRLLT